MKQSKQGIYARYIKRILDVILSGCALVVLSPVLLIVAVLVRTKLGSPVIFCQERPGKDEKIFKMYKFRSMTDQRDENGELLPDEVRLTKFGRALRSTSLDELPELWNIFKGDMSIVGPRPHMLQHTELYSKLVNKYMVRHLIKPGITGWAQVTGYRGETHELSQMEGRVRRDIWYLENWSLLLDIRIMLLTVWNALKRDENAY